MPAGIAFSKHAGRQCLWIGSSVPELTRSQFGSADGPTTTQTTKLKVGPVADIRVVSIWSTTIWRKLPFCFIRTVLGTGSRL
jgi:hypothetical protein